MREPLDKLHEVFAALLCEGNGMPLQSSSPLARQQFINKSNPVETITSGLQPYRNGMHPFILIREPTSQWESFERSDYLRFALDVTGTRFPWSFAERRTLREGRELEAEVSALVWHVMDRPFDPSILENAASIALRFCMYLLTMAFYTRAAGFATRFAEWCRQDQSPNFKMVTSFHGKAAVADALAGKIAPSLGQHRKVYLERRSQLGKAHAQTMHGLNNMAIVAHNLKDIYKAAKYQRAALTLKTKQLGAEDPDTLLSLHNLAIVLLSKAQYNAAESMFRRTLNGWLQHYKSDDLFVLTARSNLGIALYFQNRFDEAEAIHRHVFTERQLILGKSHHETMKSQSNIAMIFNETGRHVEAEKLWRDVYKTLQNDLGASHPDTLKTQHNIVTALHDQGRYGEAEATLSGVIPHLQTKYGETHSETLEALEFRAILLHCLKMYVNALELATEVYQIRKENLGYDHDDTQRSLLHVRDLAENCEEESIIGLFSGSLSIAVA